MFTKSLILASLTLGLAGSAYLVSRASLPNDSRMGHPVCCMKHAYCCSVKRPCCQSSETMVARNDPVAKPSCCMKQAYCCSVKRTCCRQSIATPSRV